MLHNIDYNDYFKNIMEILNIDGGESLALTEALEIDYQTAKNIADYLVKEELMTATYKEDEIFVTPTEDAQIKYKP